MSTPWSGPQIRDTPRIKDRHSNEFTDVEIEQAADAYLDAGIASDMALANLHSRGLEADFEREARVERMVRRQAQREQAAEFEDEAQEDEEDEANKADKATSSRTRHNQRNTEAVVEDQEPGAFTAPAQMSWINRSSGDSAEQRDSAEPQRLRDAVAEAIAAKAASTMDSAGGVATEGGAEQRGSTEQQRLQDAVAEASASKEASKMNNASVADTGGDAEQAGNDKLDQAKAVLIRDKQQQDAFLVDLERTKRSILLEYAHGGAEDENNPFAKENAKASRADRMNQIATRHDVMVGHMVSSALYPLKQGADADAVVQVMGTGMAMWCLSPAFRKSVDDKLFGRLHEAVKRGVEKEKASITNVGAFASQKVRDAAGAEGLNLGRSYDRFLDAVTMATTSAKSASHTGNIPMTAESAAATLMRTSDQAYQAMRNGEDATQVLTQFAELTEDLHARCAADGVGPREVNREFRGFVAERMRHDPGYAARFVETHAGKIRPCPERDKGKGLVWSQRWQVNSGGFLDGMKTPVFTPRAPLGLEDHVVTMGAAIAHDLKSSGLAGREALEETIAGYNAATQFPEQMLDNAPATAGTSENRVLAAHSRGVGMMQAMVDDGFAPAEAHEAFRMAIEGAHNVAGKDKTGPLATLQGEPNSATRKNYDRIQNSLVSGVSGNGIERRLRPMPGTVAAQGMAVLEASRAEVDKAASQEGKDSDETVRKPKSLIDSWDEKQRAGGRRSREQLRTSSAGGRHRMETEADAEVREETESEASTDTHDSKNSAVVRRNGNVRRSRAQNVRRARRNQQINAAMVAQGRDVDLAGSMDKMRSDEITPEPNRDGADKQLEGP